MRYFSLRDLDWLMVITAIFISAMGVLQIYSATQNTKWQGAWWKQIIFITVGLVLMWLVAAVDYHSLLGRVPVMYLLSMAILLADLEIRTEVVVYLILSPYLRFT